MTDPVALLLDAGRDVLWRGHANRSGRALAERNEAIDRLRMATAGPRVVSLSEPAAPQLRALIRAIVRVAECSWANRRGERYYERKQAFAELRGCFEEYDRAAADR